jgi:peptide deformylase
MMEEIEQTKLDDLAEEENLQELEILKYSNINLKLKSNKVKDFDKDYSEFIKNLLYTMKLKEAISISAPSVGNNIQLIISNIDSPVVMFNPVLISTSKEFEILEEGMISIPDYFYKVKRFNTISFAYQNELGEHLTATATDLTAACIQHEIDIINGKSYIDNLGTVKKFFETKKLKKILKNR